MNTYLYYYNNTYKRKLQEIDIHLQTLSFEPMNTEEIASLLEIDIKEINSLINQLNIETLDTTSFLKLMKHGSSDICKLFNRQLHVGVKNNYTAFDISYIYQIPHNNVLFAMDRAELQTVTEENIPQLFSHIEMV